jgi:zinc protease
LPVDPAVRNGTLDNGLTYYIRQNNEPQNRAALWLAVNAGSAMEDDDQKGLAHFLEHMLFNGTRRFPGPALIEYLESIGMQFGPDVNAYTSFDETVYQLLVPTDKPELVEKGLDVLEDWAGYATIDPAEVDKERGVIVEEWRLREQTASGRINEKIIPLLLSDSQYAERLPIGDMDIVRNAPAETLRRFYEQWYRPDLMSVIAVGDFDPDQMEAMIRERFSRLPMREDTTPRPSFEVPRNGQTRALVATDKENPDAVVQILFRVDDPADKTVADFRGSLVDQLIATMFKNRLEEIRQQPNAPFVFAQVGGGDLVRDVGLFYGAALIKDTGISVGLEALTTELERARQHGFTQDELDQAKAELTRAVERQYQERDNQPSDGLASEYAANFLEGQPIHSAEFTYETAQQLLPGIVLDAINARVPELMPEGDRIVLLIAPEKEGLIVPTDAELLGLFEGALAKDIAPYVAQTTATEIMTDTPAPAAITSERTIDDLGVTEITLANGVRVLMKPTDFRQDQVLFSGSSAGGASLASDEDYPEAVSISQIVGQSGIGALSQAELDRLLARQSVSVGPYIGELEEGVFGSAPPQNLEAALQLVYLYATQPKADDAAFDLFKEQQRAFLGNRALDPDAARDDAIDPALCGASIRCGVLPITATESIDLTRAGEIYRERLGDWSDGAFSFVGNLDVAQLKQLAQVYLGNLPASGREETWKDALPEPPAKPITQEIFRGQGDRSVIELIYAGEADLDYAGRVRLNALEKLLEIRLLEEIREARSGTYSPGVSASWSDKPEPGYRVRIVFSADPKRAKELTEATLAVLDDLKQNGPSEDDLAKVREIDLRENNYWLGLLSTLAEDEARALDTLQFNAATSALTTDDLKGAAEQFLLSENLVQVTQYPEGFRP